MITLIIVFFWVFPAYSAIQFYLASTFGSSLAADSVSTVYLTFTLTCLISPGTMNNYGCRASLYVGVLGYASFVLVLLLYFLIGGEDVIWARRLVVVGSAVLGCGASTLWTAYDRFILQYASRAEEMLDIQASKDVVQSKSNTQTRKLIGLFWAMFQCSSLVGGSIPFIYNNKKPEGSTVLYALFRHSFSYEPYLHNSCFHLSFCKKVLT